MPRVGELADVLGLVYDAALQVDGWPDALSEVGLLLGATSLILTLFRRTGVAELVVQDRQGDADHLTFFIENFNRPESNPAIAPLSLLPPGGILLREQHQSDRQWHASAMYRELYRPRGLYHSLGTVVSATDTHFALLGVNRSKRAGAFSAAELALLRRLIPHLERALQLGLRLGSLDQRVRAHEVLWDGLPYGVVLFDRGHTVLWSNRVAAAILTRADGLMLRRNRLVAGRIEDNSTLQRALSAAVATSEGRGTQPGMAFPIGRPSGARPFEVQVLPLQLPASAFGQRACAVLFVTDPELRESIPTQRLAQRYGLTPRETALLVLLLDGQDLREAAEALGVGRHTARTHLRALFGKTGTRRQSELVRRLTRELVGWVEPG